MTLADDPSVPGAATGPPLTRHERSAFRSVAIPTEHGGWGLTIEPVLLGLLVRPSVAGALIGAATMLAFLSRTPVKIVLVDHHRGRRLHRSRVALVVAAVEVAALAALVAVATGRAGWSWWAPVVVAAPMVVVELWYDARSRSRRLVPELLGAVGIAAAAASIAIAGGANRELAAGLWLVLGARAIGSIPFVRAQIVHLRRGRSATASVAWWQAGSIAVGALAVAVDGRLAVGFGAIVAMAAFQLVSARHRPTSAKVLGFTQMGLGFGLVIATAVGVAIA